MSKENILQVGYARADITPDYQVNLSGYGDDEIRFSEGVRDPVCLTCIAITSGEDTILLYDADLLSVNDRLADQARERVCPATGLPADKMFFGATHSHSAPAIYTDRESDTRFRETFLQAAVKIAQEALADRAPSQMLTNTKIIKGMNFVRHYLTEAGGYTGSNFGDQKARFIGHAAESDPRLLLIKFAREGKPDVVLMNWQGHNDNVRMVGYNLVSSSYVGRVREKFEAETGMHFAFFMGASGNQNTSSRIPEEHHNLDFIEYGHKMAMYAIETMKNLKPVEGTQIVTKQLVYEAPVDHSWDHLLEQAKEVHNVWKTVGKPEGDALGKTYGFTSSYQSRDIIARAAMGPTTTVVLNAFRIGEMGFITSPNEVFSTVGIHVRLHGPFENTFIITGNCRYLPCMAAYEYRSYESDTGLFAKGTAEKVADTFVDMLDEIYG